MFFSQIPLSVNLTFRCLKLLGLSTVQLLNPSLMSTYCNLCFKAFDSIAWSSSAMEFAWLLWNSQTFCDSVHINVLLPCSLKSQDIKKRNPYRKENLQLSQSSHLHFNAVYTALHAFELIDTRTHLLSSRLNNGQGHNQPDNSTAFWQKKPPLINLKEATTLAQRGGANTENRVVKSFPIFL